MGSQTLGSSLGQLGLSSCQCGADLYMKVTGDWDSAECLQCPAHSSGPDSSLDVGACTCHAGYRREGDACVECGVGRFCPGDQAGYACSADAGAQAGCVDVLTTATATSTSAGDCSCPPYVGVPLCPVNQDASLRAGEGLVENVRYLSAPHMSGLRSPSTTDINNDGARDLVVRHNILVGGAWQDTVTVLLGSPQFALPADLGAALADAAALDGRRGFRIVNVGGGWMETGDMDGDGLLDLVIQSGGSGYLGDKVTIFYGKAAGSAFQPVYDATLGSNRDARASGSADFTMLEGPLSFFFKGWDQLLGTGDYNGDGLQDLVATRHTWFNGYGKRHEDICVHYGPFPKGKIVPFQEHLSGTSDNLYDTARAACVRFGVMHRVVISHPGTHLQAEQVPAPGGSGAPLLLVNIQSSRNHFIWNYNSGVAVISLGGSRVGISNPYVMDAPATCGSTCTTGVFMSPPAWIRLPFVYYECGNGAPYDCGRIGNNDVFLYRSGYVGHEKGLFVKRGVFEARSGFDVDQDGVLDLAITLNNRQYVIPNGMSPSFNRWSLGPYPTPTLPPGSQLVGDLRSGLGDWMSNVFQPSFDANNDGFSDLILSTTSAVGGESMLFVLTGPLGLLTYADRGYVQNYFALNQRRGYRLHSAPAWVSGQSYYMAHGDLNNDGAVDLLQASGTQLLAVFGCGEYEEGRRAQ